MKKRLVQGPRSYHYQRIFLKGGKMGLIEYINTHMTPNRGDIRYVRRARKVLGIRKYIYK